MEDNDTLYQVLDMVQDKEADNGLPQKVVEMGNFELDLEDLNLNLLFGNVNEKDVPGHEKRG